MVEKFTITLGKQTWCNLLTQIWFILAANKSSKMYNIKILQWNCRGLENKIYELFLFLTNENNDIVCLNEVKKWQKHFTHEKNFIVTEAKASSFHASIIIAKKVLKVKEVRSITSRKNSNGQTLEIIGVNLETTIIGNLWIINVYNSPNQNLNFSEIFDSNLQNMLICGDFNSPYQELNCTYNTKNGKKLLEIIDNGNFKLLKNGYPTYQSNQHQSQSMLDLHFCSLSIFKYFDNFQVLEDFGSDNSSTLTSLKLKIQTEIDLQAKVNFQKFRKHAKFNYKHSCLYPPNYPKKDNLNEINHNLIDLNHKSIEQSYVNNTNHQISSEIIDLIKQKKKIRRQLKVAKHDTFSQLRRKINFLQREIGRAIKRSNGRQNRKLIEAAKRAGNKGFWKAIQNHHQR